MQQQGTFRLSIQPVILIAPELLETIKYFVAKNSKECHWFHRVTRIQHENTIAYHLHDFLVPVQEVSSATVETEGPGMHQSWKLIQEERGLSLQELGEVIKTTACWCHSHVNMGTGPSGVDNKQWSDQKELATRGQQTGPQLMMIFNKNDSYFSRVWDPQLMLEFENVPILSSTPIDRAGVDTLIKSRIKERPIIQQPSARPRSIHEILEDGPRMPYSLEEGLTANKPDSGSKKNSKGRQTAEQSIASRWESLGDEDESETEVDDVTYGMITAICEDLNKTTSEKKSTDLVKDLIDTIEASPVSVNESDYLVLDTLVFGTPAQIKKLCDSYLALSSALKGEQWPQKQFMEHCATSPIEPSDVIGEALEIVAELDKAFTPADVEAIFTDWIARIHSMEWDEINGR